MEKRRNGSTKSSQAKERISDMPNVDDTAAEQKADIGMNETDNIQDRGPETPERTTSSPTSIEEVKQRIRQMTQDIDDTEHPLTPALHDTVLDERNDVMQVINELEDQLDRHQEIRESLEHELAQANEKLQAAGQRNQELEWQHVTLQTRLEALEQVRGEVSLLEEEVANANGRLGRLTEEYNSIEKERTRLKSELKAANKQLEEVWTIRKERDGLRSDIKDLTARFQEMERGRRDTVEERNNLQARLQQTQASLDEIRSERQQHQVLLRAAEDRAREIAQVQDELLEKIESLRGEKKTLQTQLAHLERENARLLEQRHFYETEVTSLRNANRTTETALASVKKAFAEVRVALTETKTRARRRIIETWPRVGIPLRGMDNGDIPIADEDIDTPISGREAVAATDRSTIGNNGDA
ncbi:MAG: hypothetical protein PVJ57_02005 [Phycisphaerae bacterium]